MYTGRSGRKKLDEKIEESLKDNQKVVVINDINLLPFSTAQILMKYIDRYNDLPEYPHSVLLLTTRLPFSFSEHRDYDQRRAGIFFREELWGGHNAENNVTALWSRLSDGLLLVKPEYKRICYWIKYGAILYDSFFFF